MKKQDKKKFESILDECIERMGHGASLEECLRDYSQHAQELRPLLILASGLKSSMAVEPSAQARAAGRDRLRAAIHRTTTRKAPRLLSWLAPVKGWATVGALAVVVFGGGFGVVQASSDSVHVEILYPVKHTVEEIRLARPFQSRESKARLSAELAARRAEEMAVLARENKPRRLLALAERVDRHVARAADLSGALVTREVERLRQAQGPSLERLRLHRQQALRSRLERDFRTGMDRLVAIASQAPPEARPRIREAAQRLKEHYQEALHRIDGQLRPQAQPAPDSAKKSSRPAPTRGLQRTAPAGER